MWCSVLRAHNNEEGHLDQHDCTRQWGDRNKSPGTGTSWFAPHTPKKRLLHKQGGRMLEPFLGELDAFVRRQGTSQINSYLNFVYI